MKAKLILFILLFLRINFLFAQQINLRGIVRDNNTHVQLSGVNIHTKDNKIGTFSSVSGNFSLYIPSSYENDYLYFSSIGYKTDSILIKRNNEHTDISLLPITYEIKEIDIMPAEDYVISLLREAYNKIPENYPMQPTLYTGFYQESFLDEEGSLYYLIEAETSVYKEKYDKIYEMAGQVELLRSRVKYIKKAPNGLIEGVFLPINNDIVLQRRNYINPDYFKNYNYTLQGIRSYSGEDCYEISFSSSERFYGTMLISVDNLAYLSFDIHSENPNNRTINFGIRRPIETQRKIRYEQLGNIWYLKQVSSYNKYNDTIFISIDYITTHVETESVRPIPIDRRMEMMDVLAVKADGSNSWVDYDILAKVNPIQLNFQFPPEESIAIFKQQTIPQSSFLGSNLLKFRTILKIGYGLSYNPKYDLLSLQGIYKYQPNIRWNAKLIVSTDLFYKQKDYRVFTVMGEYRMNLNKAGYPLMLGTSLGISDAKYSDTEFNYRHQFIVPQLSLSKRTSRLLTWELFYNFHIPLYKANTDIKSYQQIGIAFYLF